MSELQKNNSPLKVTFSYRGFADLISVKPFNRSPFSPQFLYLYSPAFFHFCSFINSHPLIFLFPLLYLLFHLNFFYLFFIHSSLFCQTQRDLGCNIKAIHNLLLFRNAISLSLPPPWHPLIAPLSTSLLFAALWNAIQWVCGLSGSLDGNYTNKSKTFGTNSRLSFITCFVLHLSGFRGCNFLDASLIANFQPIFHFKLKCELHCESHISLILPAYLK